MLAVAVIVGLAIVGGSGLYAPSGHTATQPSQLRPMEIELFVAIVCQYADSLTGQIASTRPAMNELSITSRSAARSQGFARLQTTSSRWDAARISVPRQADD